MIDTSDDQRDQHVFSVATAPFPGGFFTEPQFGLSIVRRGNAIRAIIPDFSGAGDSVQVPLGRLDSTDEAVSAIAQLIEEEDLETPLAVWSFYSTIDSEQDPFLASLDHFFWLRVDSGFEDLLVKVSQMLLDSNAVYQHLAEILSFRSEVLRNQFGVNYQNGFSELFRTLKA